MGLPVALRASIGPKIEFAVRRIVLGGSARLDTKIRPGPLIVSNYGDHASGLARAGRLTAEALRKHGLAPIEHDVRSSLADGRIGRGALASDNRGGVWIGHCNPEHLAPLLCHITKADWEGRYRIGYWAWELPVAPAFWLWMARFFHEIWTPSDFVTRALAGAPSQVRTMPHPVQLAPPRTQRLEGCITLLAMADLRSAQARKNPLGAIEAFCRAFPCSQRHARLRVKLSGTDFDPAAARRVRAAATRPDIELIEDVLSDEGAQALIADSDIFVSLHRSEGFGLPIAEAMAHGIPALATAWSGNLDFMTGLDDLLVSYRSIPVEDTSGVYTSRSSLWADPDLDDAARKLRTLVDNAGLRTKLGERCRLRIAGLQAHWKEHLSNQPWVALVS